MRRRMVRRVFYDAPCMIITSSIMTITSGLDFGGRQMAALLQAPTACLALANSNFEQHVRKVRRSDKFFAAKTV